MATHAITEAFGFSGSYIAKRLLNAGETVVTLTNSPDRASPLKGQDEGLLNFQSMEDCF